VSDRRDGSNRGNGVNVPGKAVNKLKLGGKTRKRAASKPGRAANAPIKSASKSKAAVKARSEDAINPDHAGKAADNEAGEVAEDVAINGTLQVKAIVAVAVFAMASRIASEGGTGTVSVNRKGKLDPRRM
jgi:hypothetical protein